MTTISTISLRNVPTVGHPRYFSSFEIKDCWLDMSTVVEGKLNETITKCTQPGTRERRKALYRHDNPAGNLFTLCFGLVEPSRFGFVVLFIEFLCIIDDVLEDLPHEEALIEHDILCDALHGTKGSSPKKTTANTRPEWLSFLQELKAEMLAVDPVRSPALLATFEESLRARDSSAAEFDSIEKYIPYRLINFDYEFVSQLVLWAMAIDLPTNEAQSDSLAEFKQSIGVVVGLVNDYFSWEREKQQEKDSDRIRNGVAVLKKQYDLSDADAKEEVKKILVGEEAKIHAVPRLGRSGAMNRYFDGLEMFAGGYSFWCATCPRYHKPQGDSN
ncbi:hypothetical protein PM082_011553 [Marasmius tenuissimus]|nr:hypothetical protein PM082_011553 [Marasmius tenuissimus]